MYYVQVFRYLQVVYAFCFCYKCAIAKVAGSKSRKTNERGCQKVEVFVNERRGIGCVVVIC